jgi:hypothetical protein
LKRKTYGIPVLCSIMLLSSAVAAMAEDETSDPHHHSVQSVEQRLEKVERQLSKKSPLSGLAGNIHLNGIIEVEATVARKESPSGTAENSSDVSLATAQLDISAEINRHVNGRTTFLYEEGEENDHVIVDEAIIAINGGEQYPFSVNAGKMYVPFGNYNSHFISDPLTLVLGETNDTAVMAGYEIGPVAINGSLFKGAIRENNSSDKINTFTGGFTFALSEETMNGLALNGGASYISNLAATDTLQGEVTVADTISDEVGGWSAFASLEFQHRYSLYLEYLAAMDDFSTTDFSFSDAANQRPVAWNIEAGAMIMDRLEVALRYGGSDEAGTLLAEKQYGVALLYDLFDNTSLALEYLSEDFSDNSSNRQGTVQIAVEF